MALTFNNQSCKDLQMDIRPPLNLPKDYKFKNLSAWIRPVKKLTKKPTPTSSDVLMDQINIPDNFSWYKQGGNQIENGSRNQASCGCCWAFALASVVGDSYALKYNIAAPYPSAANLVSCGGESDIPAAEQCNSGGSPYDAAKWLVNNKIHSETCYPFSTIVNRNYVPPDCTKFPKGCCVNCCDDNVSNNMFTLDTDPIEIGTIKGLGPYYEVDATIKQIKLAVMHSPVVSTIAVPSDLNSWWNEQARKDSSIPGFVSDSIYTPQDTIKHDEGHAIVITGWGKENGIDFWEIRNSWGSPGYAKFAMTSSIENSNLHYGLDAPIIFTNEKGQMVMAGGCIAVEAGSLSLPIESYTKGNNKKSIGPVYNQPKKYLNIPVTTWKYILIGILIILVISSI